MSDASQSLAAAVLGRTTAWEEHLAEALGIRFPDLDPADAKVWAYTTMAMLRLMQCNAHEQAISYADAARDDFDRLGVLTASRRPRRTAAAPRAKRAG